jgi:UDP:flavonoid glycosyltransferase YjiC (YdhE family)
VRFSVVTVGSEGDTRPLAALCRGLLDRGHELELFADAATLSLPQALGVPCEALQGDIKSIMPVADLRQKLRFADLVRVGASLKALIAANSAAWLRAVGQHAQSSDAILFSSLALGVGLTLRDELGKTTVGLAFQPGGAPTREFSAPGFPPLPLPRWLNALTHRLAMRQLWSLFARSAPKARREVFGTMVTKRPAFHFPMLYGVSKELVAQPADWPADHVICGHWSTAMSDWQPPRDLEDFIGAEPPLYAGFGSPSAFVRAERVKALVDAVAGRRVVFSPGWSDIDRSALPDNFFVARDVPHEWLFPRVSAAIHHGGAGTTHTAARAGVPQVILPFGGDQFFWAARMAERGAAAKTSGKAARSAAVIARMIAFAELDSTRLRARKLGEAMAREDGVQRAALELEALLERNFPK